MPYDEKMKKKKSGKRDHVCISQMSQTKLNWTNKGREIFLMI